MKRSSSLFVILSLIFSAGQNANADPYKLQYGGRLTQTNGRPLSGSISILASFFASRTGGTSIASQMFNSIPLTDGVFNLTIELTPAEFHSVFSAPEVWIEITDTSSGNIYPRQRFTAVPFAFKVPVDGTSLGYDANGQMRVQGLAGSALPSGSPADGQILKWRDATGWEWGSDNTGVASGSVDSAAIQDGSISNVDIASGAAISGSKISPNFGSQNITTTGIISGNGSGLTNLPAGPLGSSIDSSEIADGTIVDADIAAGAAIAQSKINGLTTALAGKEPAIASGTASQYLKGDKSWSTLDTSAVPENINLYYTDARARSAINSTGPVVYDSATGTISMAAATSVASGYLSFNDWLIFNSKQAAITALSTVNAGSLSSAQQSGLELKPFGSSAGQAGEIRFIEATGSGSNYVGFKAPDSIGADKIWTLPSSDGTSGQFLTTNGSGVLSWTGSGAAAGTVTGITAGTGLSGGTITTSGTIDLANTAVSAGSYTRADITVDAQGRLTSAANGGQVNLATEVSGTLPLANGGTGSATAAGARTNLGLGSLATLSTVSSSEITDGAIADADISSSAAIADTKLATISTANKVANSATTATSANTASAIVARDTSGNFTAGTITATLNGSATSFTGSLAGDVSGTQGSTTVAALRGRAVSASAPDAGNVLAWDGSAWTPTLLATGGLSWNVVTATTATAAANNGYITNHASSRVTITLPGSCSLGDMIRVAGSGAGGWALTKGTANFLSITGSSLMTAFNSSFANQVADLICSATGSPVTWKMAALSSLFPPVLELISPQTLTYNQAWTYQLVASDPYGGTLSYFCVSNCPPGLSVNSTTGLVSWTPSSVDTGTWNNVIFAVKAGSLSAQQVAQLTVNAVTCGGTLANNCYSGTNSTTAKAVGIATTPLGKQVVLTAGGFWVEKNGTRILKADGTDNWSMQLSLDGRSYTQIPIVYSPSTIAGRACPPSVFTPGNLTTANTCLYYDAGVTGQGLTSNGSWDQSTPGSIQVGAWNHSTSGNGASASWFEGNVQACASKGMRLPTLYETSASAGFSLPVDASPSWALTNGVPSVSGYTWTATAYNYGSGWEVYYFTWSGGSISAVTYGSSYAIRCVVP